MASKEAAPMKDAVQNAWSAVFATLFFVVLSVPYLALAYSGPVLSLATILPVYALGAVTGYGWTFKRGTETTFCGVAPVFGLLVPGCLAAFLLDLSLIARRHVPIHYACTLLNVLLLVASGLLVLWMVYSLLALILAIGKIALWRR